MEDRSIRVPVSLLLAPDLPASVKLVWAALQLQPGAGPAQLEALTGLSRHTVLTARTWVEAGALPLGDARVRLPGAVLAGRRLGSHAKLLYGLLQGTPGYRGGAGRLNYASLCAFTGWSRNTLKKAMRQLEGAGWVRLVLPRAGGHISFKLGTPEARRAEAEAGRAFMRIRRAQFEGEAIMQEYLSLLIDSTDYVDNIRPGWLINPLTGERLELDRLYGRKVAFEYQGDQHFQASAAFTKEEVDAQKLRDYIKAGICLHEGVRLILVLPEDLSLRGMSRKVGQVLPLRSLVGRARLIEALEDAAFDFLGRVDTRRKASG